MIGSIHVTDSSGPRGGPHGIAAARGSNARPRGWQAMPCVRPQKRRWPQPGTKDPRLPDQASDASNMDRSALRSTMKLICGVRLGMNPKACNEYILLYTHDRV